MHPLLIIIAAVLTLFTIIGIWVHFEPHDWYECWALKAYWETKTDFGTIKRHCSYTIYFSPIRNRYKLECRGEEPKLHCEYPNACKKLGELNQSLINNKLK